MWQGSSKVPFRVQGKSLLGWRCHKVPARPLPQNWGSHGWSQGVLCCQSAQRSGHGSLKDQDSLNSTTSPGQAGLPWWCTDTSAKLQPSVSTGGEEPSYSWGVLWQRRGWRRSLQEVGVTHTYTHIHLPCALSHMKLLQAISTQNPIAGAGSHCFWGNGCVLKVSVAQSLTLGY